MNILFIPHSALMNVKVRAFELAKVLSKKHNIYYLYWELLPDKKLITKAKFALVNFLLPIKTFKKDNITFVKTSILHSPLNYAQKYNRKQLAKLIDKFDIDLVFNASLKEYSMPRGKCKYIYDLVDDHVSSVEPKLKRFVVRHLKREIDIADKVTAITNMIINLIRGEYGKKAVYITNGTYKPEEVSEKEIDKIKEKYGLKNKFVIGCIGNHGSWSGLKFLVKVFSEFKKEMKDIKLLVVGPGSEVDELKGKIKNEDIIFTGPINPDEITKYFKVVDIGTLPFDKSLFTDRALPIKVLEYTANEKIIVSTNLAEVRWLKFPNILIAEQEVKEWIQILKKARKLKWEKSWNRCLEPFYWGKIANKLDKVIMSLK